MPKNEYLEAIEKADHDDYEQKWEDWKKHHRYTAGGQLGMGQGGFKKEYYNASKDVTKSTPIYDADSVPKSVPKGEPRKKIDYASFDHLNKLAGLMNDFEYPEEGPMKKTEAISSLYHKAEETLVYYPRDSVEGDYSDNTINMGAMKYTNIKDLLARFFLRAHYYNHRIANWRPYCIGIISKTVYSRFDGVQETHMPMFDYDGKNIKTLIRKDVKLLQKDFNLGPAHVFRTKRGFHVIFMCDEVPKERYMGMLKVTKCCKGFKKIALHRGFGTLRVSGKYTEFDIELEYVLAPKEKELWRQLRKAHVIEALHSLGRGCGTHFAALFPDWANFQEDPKPWKATTSRAPGKGKRLKKKAPAIKELKYLYNKSDTELVFTNDPVFTTKNITIKSNTSTWSTADTTDW